MKPLSAILGLIILALTPFTVFAGWPSQTAHVKDSSNRTPVADAGPDQEVGIYEMVAFDGSGSYDPDNKDKLTYQWELVHRPAEGTSNLINPLGAKTCRLTPDAAGKWLVRLSVYDGKEKSTGDVIRVMVTPGPSQPAGNNLAVREIKVGAHTRDGIKYIHKISAKMANRGMPYSGPLEFRIMVLDQLIGGSFPSIDERVTVDSFCMRPDDEKWFPLIERNIPIPANIPTLTFFIQADPGKRINDTDRSDNRKELTLQAAALNGNPPEDPQPQPNQTDIAIADFKISGIYKEDFINTVDVYLKNKGADYLGPISILLHAVSDNNHITFEKIINVDHICLRQNDQTRVRLSAGEIPLPTNNTKSTAIKILADRGNLAQDSDRINNNLWRHRFSVGDLMPNCAPVIDRYISVQKAYGGPSSRLNRGEAFIFDCRKGRKFNMYFTLYNYCSNDNSAKLSLVYDWTHLKRDGMNRVLDKKILVDVSSRDFRGYNTKKLRIPLKGRFTREFTTFAVLSHHEKGADVLFSAPVKIIK